MTGITNILIAWYRQNRRELPWRETRDPYCIWLSEVVLQQTRVNQGLDYYNRFIEKYPTVNDLANAKEEEVLKLWQGLGYYSRARNLHATAVTVVHRMGGQFPGTAEGLMKLKGIGAYTAAAIASIAFGEAVPVVDGNVARVLSRLFALDEPVNTPKGHKILTEIAGDLMDHEHPDVFNQAVMEFGALVCTPNSPSCETCPLAHACEAFKSGSAEKYPVKLAGKAPVVKHLHYLVFLFRAGSGEQVVMRRRTGNDIWKNLYDFPCLETDAPLELQNLLESEYLKSLTGKTAFKVIRVSGEMVHLLTHRRLIARFIQLETDTALQLQDGLQYIPLPEIGKLPVPRLIDRYLESYLLPES